MERIEECQRVAQVLEGEWEAIQKKLAAGQALADHLRGKGAAGRLFLRPFPAGLSEAFLAAFPPVEKGGAR